jgi:hypothetical protein
MLKVDPPDFEGRLRRLVSISCPFCGTASLLKYLPVEMTVEHSSVNAVVCMNCGHIDLFASDYLPPPYIGAYRDE